MFGRKKGSPARLEGCSRSDAIAFFSWLSAAEQEQFISDCMALMKSTTEVVAAPEPPLAEPTKKIDTSLGGRLLGDARVIPVDQWGNPVALVGNATAQLERNRLAQIMTMQNAINPYAQFQGLSPVQWQAQFVTASYAPMTLWSATTVRESLTKEPESVEIKRRAIIEMVDKQWLSRADGMDMLNELEKDIPPPSQEPVTEDLRAQVRDGKLSLSDALAQMSSPALVSSPATRNGKARE